MGAVHYERDPDGFDETQPGAAPRHPHDPRNRPGHHERGPRRFPARRPGWTYEMVAEAALVTVSAVKRAAREGRIDMGDFASVVRWTASTAEKMQRRRLRSAS